MAFMALAPNVESMLTQLAPIFHAFMDRVGPLLDQPVVRLPYSFPLATSTVVGAGVTGQVLDPTSFQNGLEWPMEVHKVKFSQDPQHTFRDWRINIQDQIVNQPMQSNNAMVATLVDDNTGAWSWDFPWTIRPKGGRFVVTVDNLDTVNPITVDLNFVGFLLIPR